MKLKLCILFSTFSLNVVFGNVSEYAKTVKRFEGFSSKVYNCSEGYKTVGWGTNLDARRVFNNRNTSNIKIGEHFNNEVLLSALKNDLKISETNVKKLVKTFDNQPLVVKIVLVDLSYNLGYNGLSKFKRFISAIERKDYKRAAKELKNSRYYHQTGRRSKEHVKVLNSLG